METLCASKIAEFCKGRLAGGDAAVCGISRDNREIKRGELFVALCGERFDGHDFVPDAEKRGAAAALVSREVSGLSIPQIVVSDTLAALSDLARGYLAGMQAKRVCITGSVGKTTTKEMTASVLSAKYRTHKTEGNYNNNIGLPLTILNMEKAHEAAVFEIGTNHFGEILPLAELAAPEVAVITAIGDCHLEAFKTKDGVLKEKITLLDGLSEGGTAVLNGDDPYLWSMRGKLSHKTVWIGKSNPECDVFAEITYQSADEMRFKVRGSEEEFIINCGGVHNVGNALLAIGVGRELSLSDAQIAKGLYEFRNTGKRQLVYKIGGVTVIEDCYNANPDSMKAAISVLASSKAPGRRICVLGDMLELGENAEKFHKEVGAAAGKVADAVFTKGGFSEAYAEGAGKEKTRIFENSEEIANALCGYLRDGDVLLVKGSYGTRMWQVLDALKEMRDEK